MENSEETIKKAIELKEGARTRRSDIKDYIAASHIFKEIGNTYISRSKCPELPLWMKYKLFAAGNYNLFESNDCEQDFYFETHEMTKARNALARSKHAISTAIEYREKQLAEKHEEADARDLKIWKFLSANREMFECAINAREAWGNNEYIVAIDNYSKQHKLLEKLLKLIEEYELPPEFSRITRGNILGSISNTANASAKMLESEVDAKDGTINEDAIIRIFQYVLKSYYIMNQAYEENPEQSNYRVDAENSKKYIYRLLSLNYDKWHRIYLHFWDNRIFRRLMFSLNPDQYVRIEKEIYRLNQDRVGYLLIISLIVCAVFILVLVALDINITVIVACVLSVEVLNLVVSASILKASDRISEKGYLDLIGKVLSFQKDVFVNRFKKSNDV